MSLLRHLAIHVHTWNDDSDMNDRLAAATDADAYCFETTERDSGLASGIRDAEQAPENR
jgi:hypothetical protein